MANNGRMPSRNRGARGNMKMDADSLKILKRTFSYVWKVYGFKLIIFVICILLAAASQTTGAIFIAQIINNVISPAIENNVPFSELSSQLNHYILLMACLYTVGIISSIIYTQLNAVLGQKFLNYMRKITFDKMETLPIKYFDQHTHGNIMSIYTNDIDAVRQLVTQSIPSLIKCVTIMLALVVIMLVYSIWLALILFVGVFMMFLATKNIGAKSGRFFVQQQQTLGQVEGFIEESMNGQKVIKVFCHEEESKKDFKKKNDLLGEQSYLANRYSNILGPITGNIGNIMYAVIAVIGTILFLQFGDVKANLTIIGMTTFSSGVVVSFLNMARQFSQNVNNAAMQINSVVMGIAGAKRVFDLMDEQPEQDEGYVTLVNVKENEDGTLVETQERTGLWAWKHPHEEEKVDYIPLKGDIRMFDVDFGYNPDKIVLHNVTLYAEPGQRVAFVGATGAGKTTITNLINRFYDIADGKIRYDGININKIKKSDLRRSLGIVLQDTNLFTGTVMENIRYGRLDATDEEVYEAAKIANAYDFITRLPQGFNTMLESDGANLSQGQRQLLSIARAACCNAPVMIMDEATSSIDTRTEALVQEGTDKLMQGRTVFVIAHRLSTVQNCDVIMVLDHGRIIERGNHEELIAKKGNYYQLYTGAFELE